MRILHTSDWHLGARHGNVDRTADAFARIEQLCDAVDQHQVDCLLIAGDVFDEYRAERLPQLLHRLGSQLRPRVEDGLQVVALAGNHDRAHVFPLIQEAAALLGGRGAGRVTFTERPAIVEVSSRDGAEAVQIVCLPYPMHDRYDLPARDWATGEAKRRELADVVRQSVADLAQEAERRAPGVPAIMAGHLLIRGVSPGDGFYCLSEAEDVPVDRGALPGYAYVALGHIHRPQALGLDTIRYSGSIERMDRGESGDDKSATLVTLADGIVERLTTIPLDATPFKVVEARTEDDLVAAWDAMPEPERTLVSLVIHDDGVISVGALLVRARSLFPRIYGTPDIRRTATETRRGSSLGLNRDDVSGAVRRFLTTAIPDDDGDRSAVLALADELLANAGHGPSPADMPASGKSRAKKRARPSEGATE